MIKIYLNGVLAAAKEYYKPEALSTVMRAAGVHFPMPCGGGGRCGKCRVRAHGMLSEPSAEEKALLSREELDGGIRLACQTRVTGAAEIYTESINAAGVIGEPGEAAPEKLEPAGKKLGASFDLGTTTVAASLYELTTGRLLGHTAAMNPQSAFGADVMTRMERAMAGDGRAMMEAVSSLIIGMCTEMCRAAGRSISEIDSLCLAGNTAMCYLLMGLDPASVAVYPFIPDNLFGKKLFHPIISGQLNGTELYIAPSASAYVGGDIVSAVYASGLAEREETAVLADIGTNGEIVLYHNGELTCASTSAGPAFEGAGIYMGMTASPGAVSSACVSCGELVFRTVGGEEARGICGSGIIDITACLLRLGVVDETGAVMAEGHRFTEFIETVNGGPAFRLPGTGILVTGKDIRAVQLAKSAIKAGIETLLAEKGIGFDAVGSLYIAGGFGSFINIENAEYIGLFPRGASGKARAIGNAAAAGMAQALLDRGVAEKLGRLAGRMKNIDLSASPVFTEAYTVGMLFGDCF